MQKCREAGGTVHSTIADYRAGRPFKCDTAGSGRSAAAPANSVCKTEGKINVDWVFTDKGASQRYAQLRHQGNSPFEAVVGAQAHNPKAQKVLRDCASWVVAYLASKGEGHSGQAGPPARRLSTADCKCISVIPTGESDFNGRTEYRVTNSCDEMNVRVLFTGDILKGLGVRSDAFSSWADAGPILAGLERVVRAPAWKIVSIAAVTLTNPSSTFTCRF